MPRALIVLVGLAGCGDTDDPAGKSSPTPEQNRREDFLWSDRLSIAPPPAPVTTAPSVEWTQRIAAATWSDLYALVGALPRGDASVRCALESTLGSPSSTPLARALAATCLGHLGDAAAASALCKAIGDGDSTVQVAALRGLGTLRVPWTMPRLIKVFGRYVNHPNLLARVEAAAALLRFQNVAGVPLCIKVLKEHTRLEDNANREWARSSRVALEKECALAALTSLTGDDFGYSADAPLDAQEHAIVAFEAWWSEHGDALVRAQPAPADAGLMAKVDELVQGLDIYQVSTSDDARYVLARLGPRMLPEYVRRLSDPSIYVRSHLLDVIAEIAPYAPSFDAEVRAGLDNAIKDPAAAVRTQAIRVFGALRRADLLPQLAASLQDADGSVRVAAARALGDSGLNDAVGILAPVVARTQHDELWAAAVLSSIRLGTSALTADLLQMLVAEDVVDQSAALDALGALGAPIGGFPLGGPPADRATARTVIETWLATHPPSRNEPVGDNEEASKLK